ncbi:uncharacterized protein MONBRDRAFT_25649 [Monosiga brevicollis MX1]|uniref:Uncharacterized protein n=1 Tax=Monosiga brevicollis TaxID=81824 RepID=A9V008_MONBE|nr:uncharacterized protein MONBRDRAFT_25649 [Monosiga brevicollis MX1]EDQ89074.1 predicted protein [Monosiga brevicollis MX1]|eukprot:XP_001746179.1 hypothetical protein [Monosiga brevicollis MX1]
MESLAEIFTAAHVIRFIVETITDLALLPSLDVVSRRGRHFEFFIGAFQFLASTMYNMTDALEVPMFLTPRDWHRLTNVLTITYGLHLCIFLMGNRSEARDNFLRYLAFALVWIAQIKDAYWMFQTQYTAYVVVFFLALPMLNMLLGSGLPVYNRPKVIRGFLALMVAGVCFYLGLDDENDAFRLFHGLSQVVVGVALFYLWQAVPEDHYKKHDTPLPMQYRRYD